jgi:polar amino acid transport system substrate-binding protein
VQRQAVRGLILALLACVSCGLHAQVPEFVIGGIPESPLRLRTPDGQIKGFDVEVIDHVMKKLHIRYRIELVDSPARLARNAQARPSPYDMLFSHSYTHERVDYLRYPGQSHIRFHWNFFLRKEDEGKFVFRRYADLAGVTIGVTQGFAYSEEFHRAIAEIPLKVDVVATNKVQLDKLLAHRFDLVPLNTKSTLYEARERGIADRISVLPNPIKEKPYYNAFVKSSSYPRKSELIARYDAALLEMKRDGSLARIQARYGFDKGPDRPAPP